MNHDEFRQWMHRAADWSADYRRDVNALPVRSQLNPGDITAQLQQHAPEDGESMEAIFSDFERIMPAGITHWQHARFFAYFPSNAAPAAVVAEVLATTIGAQCMLWQTSPAATELEVRMIDWLRQATGLPEGFSGVLQDTASSATLCAILTMRERTLGFTGNQQGLFGKTPLRVYASGRTHSSIDKAMWIAGLGQDNLVKIDTDADYAMKLDDLAAAIERDRVNGLQPAGIIVCVGGTSIGATDNVRAVCEFAQEQGLFTHVDAAWAGSAMICPEYRYLWDGIELADSLVLNPHKWLGAPMECSAHFVRQPEELVRTMAIQPEYLKTYGQDGIINFSEWGVQLGRRFRALKLWFLMRHYGLEGLRQRIRNHVDWTAALAQQLHAEDDFEVVTEPMLALFSFRYYPQQLRSAAAQDTAAQQEQLNTLNLALINAINDDGNIYLTQTQHEGSLVLRFTAGHFDMDRTAIDTAFETICRVARSMPV